MFVSGFLFRMFSAFGGEKSLFRPFVFNKFSALDTLSDQGHNVALPFLQFVARFPVDDGLGADPPFAPRADWTSIPTQI
jgi:hypothetical protein